MNVIVVMVTVGAGFAAEGVFSTAFIVEDFMKQSFIQKCPQRSVNRYAVMVGTQTTFDVIVRQRVTGVQEQVEHFLATIGMAKFKGLERLGGWGHKIQSVS